MVSSGRLCENYISFSNLRQPANSQSRSRAFQLGALQAYTASSPSGQRLHMAEPDIQANIGSDLPPGKIPVTPIWRRISRFSRSMVLLLRILDQCSPRCWYILLWDNIRQKREGRLSSDLPLLVALILEPVCGLEPQTCALRVRCSTN